MVFVDTHSHLQAFAETLEEELALARQAGVATGIVAGGTLSCVRECLETARKSAWGAAIGLHPLYVAEHSAQACETMLREIETHAQELAAVGEVGLDFYMQNPDRPLQESVFEAHLDAARRFGLPVSVHSRRALYRVLDIMRGYPGVRGVLHAFAGSVQEMRRAVDMGLKIGVGGAVSYEGSKRVRAVAQAAPDEALVLETDCPDMAPSFAGDAKSHAHFIARYAAVVAQLRKTSVEDVARISTANALEVFPRLNRLRP